MATYAGLLKTLRAKSGDGGPIQTVPWIRSKSAAALLFFHRALEARGLAAAVPAWWNLVEPLAWPSDVVADRLKWSAGYPSINYQAALATWLNLAAAKLDAAGAAVDDFGAMDTIDPVAALTDAWQGELRHRNTPASAPTWLALVRSWGPAIKATWTRRAAVEALYFMSSRAPADAAPMPGMAEMVAELVSTDDAKLDVSTAAKVMAELDQAAAELDRGGVPLVAYVREPRAWDLAIATFHGAPDVEAPDVDPGVTTTDLPPKPRTPAPPPATNPPATTPPPGVAGPYVLAWQRFRAWARDTNKAYPAPVAGQPDCPKVSREQAAAILRYAVRLARKHLPQWDGLPVWVQIALALLGWTKPGDTFRLDAAWRRAMAGERETVNLWSYTLAVAVELDKRGVIFEGPHPAPEADYVAMANEAARELHERDPSIPSPAPAPVAPPDGGPTPDRIPPLSTVPPITASPSGGGGGGGGILIALALMAMDL